MVTRLLFMGLLLDARDMSCTASLGSAGPPPHRERSPFCARRAHGRNARGKTAWLRAFCRGVGRDTRARTAYSVGGASSSAGFEVLASRLRHAAPWPQQCDRAVSM